QLLDALLDPNQGFAVRRRIPRVLAEFDSQRAADGLIDALRDDRLEVRFHSGGALTRIQTRNPGIVLDRDRTMSAVLHELETTTDLSAEPLVLEHAFRLLALVVPREPVQIARHALRSGDHHLKGTSIEYLENVLPAAVWHRMRPLFEEK